MANKTTNEEIRAQTIMTRSAAPSCLAIHPFGMPAVMVPAELFPNQSRPLRGSGACPIKGSRANFTLRRTNCKIGWFVTPWLKIECPAIDERVAEPRKGVELTVRWVEIEPLIVVVTCGGDDGGPFRGPSGAAARRTGL